MIRWREGQVTGNAYAGTIKAFLHDRRLANFTPEEVSRAYQRVFGRELKTDLEADREAAKAGHRLTYNELESRPALSCRNYKPVRASIAARPS